MLFNILLILLKGIPLCSLREVPFVFFHYHRLTFGNPVCQVWVIILGK